jgi:hypothetical protein
MSVSVTSTDVTSHLDSDSRHGERLDAERLARLRDQVDAGVALDEATDVPLLRGEMARAAAATEPAAAVLAHAADELSEQKGYGLNYHELELLWGEDPALSAVKRLYDRERACWRRANGILAEHKQLVRGEGVEIERRDPYRLGAPASPPLRRRLAALSRWAR